MFLNIGKGDSHEFNLENPLNSYGFQRGLEAERIVAISQMPNGLMFLIKWKSYLQADLVPANEANGM